MRAAPAEDVDVHLAGGDEQGVRVAGGDDGVAVGEADAEAAVGDDFAEGGGDGVGGFRGGVRVVGLLGGGGGGGGGGEGEVVVALDELEVRGEGAEEGVGGGGGEVAEAEDLGDFAGGEEFLELLRGDVSIGRVRDGRVWFCRAGRGGRRGGSYLGRDILQHDTHISHDRTLEDGGRCVGGERGSRLRGRGCGGHRGPGRVWSP